MELLQFSPDISQYNQEHIKSFTLFLSQDTIPCILCSLLKEHKLFLKLFLLRVYKLNRAMYLPAFENGLLSKKTAYKTERHLETHWRCYNGSKDLVSPCSLGDRWVERLGEQPWRCAFQFQAPCSSLICCQFGS